MAQIWREKGRLVAALRREPFQQRVHDRLGRGAELRRSSGRAQELGIAMRVGFVFLIAISAVSPSATALADIVNLSCSGKFFVPEVSSVQGNTSGSVSIDFDNKLVTGILSGHITEVNERVVVFRWSFPSQNHPDHALVYRYGVIDRITGQAYQYDSRQKQLPFTDVEITCGMI